MGAGDPNAMGHHNFLKLFYYSLVDLGHTVILSHRNIYFDMFNILFDPMHLIQNPPLRAGLDGLIQNGLRYGILNYEMFTGDSFGYGSAPISSEELQYLQRLADGAAFIWSCFKEECEFYKAMSDRVHYTPYGFNARLVEIVPYNDSIIDVFYFGSLSNSRRTIVDQLRAAGLLVQAMETPGHMTRNSLIAAAHVNLSLPHAPPFSHFSPSRVVYLANNAICPLSPPPHQRCAIEHLPGDADDYGRYVHIVPAETLVDACFDWKNSGRGREEGERVFEALRQEPMARTLERALDLALA
jgi:hypothetical protein